MKKKEDHKDKVRLARRMRTQDEAKRKIPIFQTEAWTERALNKAIRARNTEIGIQYLAKKRKDEKNKQVADSSKVTEVATAQIS